MAGVEAKAGLDCADDYSGANKEEVTASMARDAGRSNLSVAL